ncbi:MAG: hypothetical protein OHK0024_15970 [Thalassobaculales bacterium]
MAEAGSPSRPGRGRPVADRRALAAGLGALALALGVGWLAAGFSPFAAVFPAVIAIVLGVCGLIVVALAFLRPAAPGTDGASWPRRAAILAVAVAWVLAIPHLGFLSSSLAGYLGALAVARDGPADARTLAVEAACGLLLVLGFYLLFSRALGVSFPEGMLI